MTLKCTAWASFYNCATEYIKIKKARNKGISENWWLGVRNQCQTIILLFFKFSLSCPAPCSHMYYSPPGFSRQEYWSRLSFPTLGYLPDPGIKPWSLISPAVAGGFFTTSATWEALDHFKLLYLDS